MGFENEELERHVKHLEAKLSMQAKDYTDAMIRINSEMRKLRKRLEEQFRTSVRHFTSTHKR
jgi:molecular chaperone GrpE (heat shock protein)